MTIRDLPDPRLAARARRNPYALSPEQQARLWLQGNGFVVRGLKPIPTKTEREAAAARRKKRG